jgi:hypothetical protein
MHDQGVAPHFICDTHEQTQRRGGRYATPIRNIIYEDRLSVLGLTPSSHVRMQNNRAETVDLLQGHDLH